MSVRDISNQFVFKNRWRQGSFEYEEISGELGEPGRVATHRLITPQRTMSRGTGEHAGHRIGIQFGAPGDLRNLSLQNPNSNTFAPKALQEAFRGPGGSYHALESQWALRLHQGYRIQSDGAGQVSHWRRASNFPLGGVDRNRPSG